MSPFFHCFDCTRVIEIEKSEVACPVCKSSKGKIIPDKEFCEKVGKDAIIGLDPATGKPIKTKIKI